MQIAVAVAFRFGWYATGPRHLIRIAGVFFRLDPVASFFWWLLLLLSAPVDLHSGPFRSCRIERMKVKR